MKAPKTKLNKTRGGVLDRPAKAASKKSSKQFKKASKPTAASPSKSKEDAEVTGEATPAGRRVRPDALSWKSVSTAGLTGLDEGGGMMMLEELEDVGVEWEVSATGTKVARLVTAESSGKRKGKKRAAAQVVEEEMPEVGTDQVVVAQEGVEEEEEEALPSFAHVDKADLDEEDEDAEAAESFDDWSAITLHPDLKRSLLALGYTKPTDIQTRAIPSGLEGRDVVGVAETGSGKTLAYSLPILSHLLAKPRPRKSVRRALSALVLCPTRELALQVVEHLQKVVKRIDSPDGEDEVFAFVNKKAAASGSGAARTPPRISIGSVVGGLSALKQKRIVERGADVLVATPGRLWDLIKTDDRLAAETRALRFLVVDEADRMIENGHFAELENIVRLTQRRGSETSGPDDDDPIFAASSDVLASAAPRADMQTFVFSATLSKDLQQNLKRRTYKKKGGKRATALEDLVERLDFRDRAPEVIDLSPEGGVVKQLKESQVECVVADKDLYLYYFLLRYPGRSIVFVGSIDGIRRLTPLFEMLQMPVWPLHSQLQQKQRLKNLDRFKSAKNAALIATDVAARGLDIPQVDHVIHFNLPRTADSYIHRSGRTARAQNPGFALQIVSPEDRGVQRGLMKSLGRTNEMPELTIDGGFIPKLRERVRIAREIEKAQHEVKKQAHDRNWLKEAAEAMDIDLDPSMMSEEEDGEYTDRDRRRRSGNSRGSKASSNVVSLKAQLRELLSEKLLARGISARYPTSGSRVIVDELIAAQSHGALLGADTAKAWDEVHGKGRKLKSGANKRKRTAA